MSLFLGLFTHLIQFWRWIFAGCWFCYVTIHELHFWTRMACPHYRCIRFVSVVTCFGCWFYSGSSNRSWVAATFTTQLWEASLTSMTATVATVPASTSLFLQLCAAPPSGVEWKVDQNRIIKKPCWFLHQHCSKTWAEYYLRVLHCIWMPFVFEKIAEDS